MNLERLQLPEEQKVAFDEQLRNKSMKKITKKEMKNICRSKYEIYNLLKYGLKIYMPNYKYCPLEFCKELLNGKKNPTYKAKMNTVDVPKWAELSVVKIYDWAFDNEDLKQFLPDFGE